MPASSFWGDIKGQSGADEVDQILGKRLFAFPKSVEFMRRVLDLIMPPHAIILDSTAGSGTTAHAVLQMNKMDKGTRKFILVQQPFDSKHDEIERFNICQKVTRERVRRVIQGYKFEGSTTETIFEEKIGLNTLKNPSACMQRIENARSEGSKKYDAVETKCDDGTVRVAGTKEIKGKTDPLGGTFSYARLSEKPILGEYRDITKNPPSREEIAKYVFYTETSAVWDKKGLNIKTGKIGEHHNTSIYLLYTPNHKDDQALDVPFLDNIVAKDKSSTIVIYCEKIWIHRVELLEWSAKHKKSVRPMIVPFNLK